MKVTLTVAGTAAELNQELAHLAEQNPALGFFEELTAAGSLKGRAKLKSLSVPVDYDLELNLQQP